jgi:hypothetical protein
LSTVYSIAVSPYRMQLAADENEPTIPVLRVSFKTRH